MAGSPASRSVLAPGWVIANRGPGRSAIPGLGDPGCAAAGPRMRVTRRLAAARARLVPGEPGQPGREGDGGRAGHIPGGAGQHAGRAGRRYPRRRPPGLRPRPGFRPDHRGRPGAVPPGRGDQRAGGRCLDRQHQPDPRALHRGRRVPDPAAPDGRQGRAVRRLVPAGRDDPGGLPGHARRGPAALRDGRRAVRRVGLRAGRHAGLAGRRRHPAPAVPGPDDEDLPGGAHVVPPLAARRGRDHARCRVRPRSPRRPWR